MSRGGVRFFGNGGGAPGMNGELRIYPGSGTVIAILSNLDPPAATRVADWLEQRLPGKPNGLTAMTSASSITNVSRR